MKKIGIIGAMELEVETLKAHMTTTKITTKAHMEFHEGTLNGTPVVIVRSGVGKVNAALCVRYRSSSRISLFICRTICTLTAMHSCSGSC